MITWKEIEVCIPAVVSLPERAECLERELKAIKKQAPSAKVTVSRQQLNGVPSVQAASANIADALAKCSRPWVLYLEDDLEIGGDFGTGVLAALNALEQPAVVAFFSPTNVGPDGLHDAGDSWSRPQCTAMPLELAQEWAKRLRTWPKDAPKGCTKLTERPLRNAALARGWKIWISIPSLVQHGAVPSAWQNARQVSSPTYRG
jgi:hypothetical protein